MSNNPSEQATNRLAEKHLLVAYNPALPKKLDIHLIHTWKHNSVVCSVTFSSDGKRLVTGCNRALNIFDTTTGELLSEFRLPGTADNYIRSVSFSPDNRYIATGGEDRTVWIWDMHAQKQVLCFEGHAQAAYSVEFSKDGRYVASGSGDNTVRLYDTISGKCVVFVPSPPCSLPGITALTLSPDGHFIVAACLDATIRIWEVETRKEVETLRGHADSVYSVKLTHDGNNLISGSLDRTVKLWDLSSLVSFRPMEGTDRCPCLKTFTGHTDYVLSVAVSHDDRWILSASKESTVRFVNRSTGETHAALRGHKNSVIAVGTCAVPESGTGGLVVTGSGDHYARLWRYTVSE